MSYDRSGNKNPMWKGGCVRGPEGRMMIYCPGHPMANICGGIYALEYRLVMAKKIGRNLRSGEIAHHLNGDKHDNRPENLALTNRRDHARTHFIGAARPDMRRGGSTWKTIQQRRTRD